MRFLWVLVISVIIAGCGSARPQLRGPSEAERTQIDQALAPLITASAICRGQERCPIGVGVIQLKRIDMPVAEMPPEDFRRSVEVNLVGVFNGCRAAAARLIAQKSGKIVNLASVLGAAGLPGYAAYSASKGGVIALTRALAVEWARYNIQVNAMAPGWFVTDMNREAFDDARVRERLLRDVPARRTGRLEEVGPLVVYLASSA